MGRGKRGLGQKATSQTIYLSLLSYLKVAINLGTYIVLARLLVPEMFGVFALATSILGLLGMLRRWGTEAAIMQEKGKNEHPNLTETIFILQIGLCLLFILLVLGALPILDNFYSRQVIAVLLALTIPQALTNIANVFRSVMQKKLMLLRLGLIEVGGTILASLAGIIMALKGFGIWSITAYYGLSVLLITVGNVLFSPFRPSWKFSRKEAFWFFHFAKKMFTSDSIEFALQQHGDKLILGSIKGEVSLGFYAISYRLSRLFNTAVLPAINQAVLPTFAKIKNQKESLKIAFSFVLRNILRMLLPLYLLLVILAPEVISLLFGQKWLPVVPIFRIQAIYAILIPLFNVCRHIHYALGKPENVLKVQAVSVVIFLGSVFPLTIVWGAKGTALGLSLTALGEALLLLRKTKKETKTPLSREILPLLASNFLAVLPTFALSLFLNKFNSLEKVLICGGVFAAIYLFFLALWEKEKLQADFYQIKNSILKKNS